MSEKKFDIPGTLALICVVGSWGVIPVFLKHLTGDIDAWVANGVRYPLAACLYWPALYLGVKRGVVNREFWKRALAPTLFSLIGQILWAEAPYHLPASLMGFLVRSSILFAVAGAVILFPEERVLFRSFRFYVGVILAVWGFLELTLARPVDGVAPSATGLALILGCSISFGLYGVSVRRCMEGLNPITSFAVISQPIAIVTFILMLCLGDMSVLPELSGKSLSLLVFSSILGIGISHVLYYVAIHRLGASISACANLLSPFATLLFAAWLLGESISHEQMFAGILVILGGAFILLAQVRVRERRMVLASEAAARASQAPSASAAE